jgi:hypothetical protein
VALGACSFPGQRQHPKERERRKRRHDEKRKADKRAGEARILDGSKGTER